MVVAGAFGAVGGIVGTGISNNWEADPLDYGASAVSGAIINMISFGLAPIGGEIVKGSVTAICRQLIKVGMESIGENIATGSVLTIGATWITKAMTHNNQNTRALKSK